MCACVCERECGVRECVRDWTAYKKNTACGQFVSVTGTYGPSDAKKNQPHSMWTVCLSLAHMYLVM